MKWFLSVYSLICLLVLISAQAQVEISEVMYDPARCTDAHCEWVELHNTAEEDISLEGCLFNGKNISGLITAQSYLLIVRNEQEVRNNFEISSSILPLSFTLRNNGSVIELGGKEECTDTFDYTPYISLAAGNDKSLEKSNGAWVESSVLGGTPGGETSSQEADNEVIEDSENQPSELPENSSISTILEESNECDLQVSLGFAQTVFADGSEVQFTTAVLNQFQQGTATVRGVISDSSGKEIKNYSPWTDQEITSRKEKIYSPQLADGEYTARFLLSNISCEDNNPKNNEVIVSFSVGSPNDVEDTEEASEDVSKTEKSIFQFFEIPSTITAGTGANLFVELFNGEKTKQQYKIWAYLYQGNTCYSCADSSEDRDAKFQELTLETKNRKIANLTIQADENLKEGEYKIKVKLQKAGQKTEKEITSPVVVQNPPEENTDSDITTAAVTSLSAAADDEATEINTPVEVQPVVVFESSSEKSRKILPFILIATLALLCLFLGLRRKA